MKSDRPRASMLCPYPSLTTPVNIRTQLLKIGAKFEFFQKVIFWTFLPVQLLKMRVEPPNLAGRWARHLLTNPENFSENSRQMSENEPFKKVEKIDGKFFLHYTV